ncbi:hypothetical protein [uncultured Fibrobacter sp.]|uniref:hypothetical protein n=1 Tax=uncultured Fibrobacter sp. TaxID=261512 RepID=UPI00338F49B8
MALRSAVQYWAETKKHPKFAGWLENNAEESMTYFNFNEGWWRIPESGIVREACRLATDGVTRQKDGRKSLLNREGNGSICFLCMNLQKRTCLIQGNGLRNNGDRQVVGHLLQRVARPESLLLRCAPSSVSRP